MDQTTALARLQISDPIPADDLELAGRKKRSSIYDELVDRVLALQAGQSVIVTPPSGIDVATLHNRLLDPMAKANQQGKGKGLRFVKQTTKDGRVAVIARAAKQ